MAKTGSGTGRRGRPPSPRPERSNVTKETFNEAYDDLVERLAKKQESDSAVANAYKRWEGVGVDKKELKRAIADGKLDAGTRQRMHENHIRNMAWLGMPLGTQTAMDLGEPKPGEGSVITLKRAKVEIEREGLAAGRAGASITSCPHAPATESYQIWTSGWHKGQRENADKLSGGTSSAPRRGRPRKQQPEAPAANGAAKDGMTVISETLGEEQSEDFLPPGEIAAAGTDDPE